MSMIWVALIVVAMLIALDKAMLPGAAILGIGALAQLIPAKEATGITLAMCILGDWMTIWAYRRDVDWKTLGRLLPNVVIGVVLGAAFLFWADDTVTKRVIGVIILVFVGWNVITMWRKKRMGYGAGGHAPVAEDVEPGAVEAESGAIPALGAEPGETATVAEPVVTRTASEAMADAEPPRGARFKRPVFGGLAGFTTMVANAGGPVTSMYFMTEGFPVRLFLGTGAWFYLVLNLVKLPFSIGLGMLTTKYLIPLLIAIPFMIATVAFGRWVSGRINKAVFNTLVIVLTVVTGVTLLI